MLCTRKLSCNDNPIPADIRLVPEGQSSRILGAHIGNNTNEMEPWLPIVERIETILERCSEMHPTMEAKRHMINLTMGSITQYLTAANGMPEHIVKRLTKLQSTFLNAPINKETLAADITQGEKRMFDLQAL
ncbi:hypothetical protein BT96DRAFT_831491 [Gymnopus androsaceus JB14]|uniref:Uncharacterized protein n=1 Tax=Gymnopus androsaceus JB14 TaxID=1447944 RepID=A0A6A4H0R3_9AGAR|nr:hypothetical protein BT96DRAFT_831491 [Gymnopus androsaceus JB14]